MRTPKSTYRRFVKFEERVAAIYLRLASHFSSDRKLSSFWLEMGMEEKQHAGLLQFCIGEGLLASDLPSEDEINRMSRLLKDAEGRVANPKLTVDEAFLLAIDLEGSELNHIYCHLTTCLHLSPYLLKRKLATLVPNHIDGLVATARQFDVGKDVLKKAQRLRKNCVQPPAHGYGNAASV